MMNKKPEINAHDLDMVSFYSNKEVRAKNAIYAVDNAMQANYTAMKATLIQGLEPVIVVQNDAEGGTFTLVNDGKTETIKPVADIFQLVKSVSHTPLGIYVIIAPYLKAPQVTDWIAPLELFKATLENALLNINETSLPKQAIESCSKVLSEGIIFINNSVNANRFSIESFEKFTADVAKDIKINMHFAAEAQVQGVENVLKKWKEVLGPEKWKNLYAIVLAIWTTEYKNQNWLILNQMMDQKMVDSHLITISIGSFSEDTVPIALDNLARIVQDNVAAAMIFSTDAKLGDALKGPEDLLSSAIEKIIGCPHLQKNQTKSH